jgi:hypothetical protein
MKFLLRPTGRSSLSWVTDQGYQHKEYLSDKQVLKVLKVILKPEDFAEGSHSITIQLEIEASLPGSLSDRE